MSQHENISRVRAELEPAIIEFFRKLQLHSPFHAQDLRDWVDQVTGTLHAPASAQRILQLMRRAGALDYEIINRRASLYQFVPNGTTEFYGLDLANGNTGRQSQSESEPCAA